MKKKQHTSDKRTASYIIIGAGPAGLTAAKMLQERGVGNVVLLEADHKLGGKCQSTSIGDHIVEFGTCYAIFSHKYILKHMKALGIKRNFLKAQRIDGRELIDYVYDGAGGPFIYQGLKYLRLRSKLLSKRNRHKPETSRILAMPTAEWLRQHNLHKVERMMHRVVTSIGYGYLDRLPLIHAFRWVDLDMFITGLIKFTVMPDGGWQHFWDRFAEGLDVRLNNGVQAVRRNTDGVTVELSDGSQLAADYLINTIPMSDFCDLTEPTEGERDVASSVKWGGYATSLLSVEAWPHDAPVNAWSETCATSDHDGELLFFREECEEENGRMLFTVGQSAIAFTDKELEEIAVFDAEKRGAISPQFVQHTVWQYMPTYSSEAVAGGLLKRMEDLQGEQRTYHTGATFSHEAVSCISRFNAQLLDEVLS